MIKRIKSKFGKDVFFAPWDCPLSGVDPLFFMGLLEVHDIRFFLGAKDAIYVVTIPRRSVFRLIDETHLGTLMDVLTEAETEQPLRKNEVWNRKTWKVWGTPFLKELGSLVFLDYPKEDQLQYLILTEDESPEFVCYAPKIDVYPGRNDNEIMERLFKEDLQTRKQKGFGCGT